MKKIVVLVLSTCLLLSIIGATCLKSVNTIACNPPADAVAVAKAALPVLEQVIAMLVPGTAAFLAAAQQINVVDTVLAGGCIATTQLDALIAYLQGPEVSAAGAKTKAPAINVQPLINWRKSVG